MTTIREKTISSLFWKLMERAGNQIVQLVVQIVMARLLTPNDFGLLSIMLVFINIGNVFVQSGLNTALIQIFEIRESDYSTVFWMSFAMSVVIYIFVFLFVPVVAAFYADEKLIWPLRVLSLVLVLNAFNSVQTARITRDLDFRRVFIATVVSVTVSGVLGIISALAGLGIWALVIQQLSYQTANSVTLLAQTGWLPRPVFEADRARMLYSFGWRLLVSGLLETGYQSMSDLIIGKQFSKSELGLVSQGKKYPYALSNMLDGAIQSVMLSAVSRVQDDLQYVKRLVRRALKTSTYVIVPFMTLFAVTASPLVDLLLGPQWLPCVPFLQMYCFICALRPIHTSNLQALNGMGRSDLYLRLEVVKKVVGISILLFCAFVLRDIYAIVAGYMVSGLIATAINASPNKKLIGYSYLEQLRDVIPCVVLSLVAGAASWGVSLALAIPPLMLFIVQVLVMLVIYFSISWIFKIEEFMYLKDILFNQIKRRRK